MIKTYLIIYFYLKHENDNVTEEIPENSKQRMMKMKYQKDQKKTLIEV